MGISNNSASRSITLSSLLILTTWWAVADVPALPPPPLINLPPPPIPPQDDGDWRKYVFKHMPLCLSIRTCLHVLSIWDRRFFLFADATRWYFFPLVNGYQEILKNVEGMVGEGVLQVQDLRGAGGKEEYSYTVFTMWPSADFLSIQSIRPISQWVSQSIAEVAAYRKLKGFETFVLDAESDLALKVAAGNLFERYAHERLAQGGTFKAVEDGSDVVLQTRRIKYFSGLTVSADPEWRKDTSSYWVPRNQNFPIVDSIMPNHMIQVSLAKSRKPMDRAVFSRLRSDLNQDAYMVLVKPEGDRRSAPVIKFRSSNEQKMLSDEDKQLVLAGDLRYCQIQALCKKYGIRANQHKEVMLKELKELVALANVQDGGSLQEEQLKLIVKTIALRSGFSVNSGWHYLTLEELFTSVKNDIHYGDYEPFFALEDDAVEDNGYATMDNWDIKLGFHGRGTTSGFESEIVYTALMEETQVTLKLAHLDGTLAGKQVRVKLNTVSISMASPNASSVEAMMKAGNGTGVKQTPRSTIPKGFIQDLEYINDSFHKSKKVPSELVGQGIDTGYKSGELVIEKECTKKYKSNLSVLWMHMAELRYDTHQFEVRDEGFRHFQDLKQ
ncbi:hypothetical protein SELMODRAFT_422422 [Selaginella moellendorffii]|uniref:SAP domain-containing protein n=1 Tax=Selaginella moellendorffii TaxID=88036 RepID=D8SIC2_SELML|nr:hypothetical protein SELMODRAFT_422422 [Selaginella moellendorffii]